MAESETSGLVRLYLASALQRIPINERWELARGLCNHSEDADDRSLPLMLWYGIEASVPENPERAVELLQASEIPLVSNHIARRLTEEMEARPESVEGLVALLAESDDTSLRKEMLQGMLRGLEGRRRAQAPKGWGEVGEKLSKVSDPQIVEWTRELSLVFGDGRAMEELRTIVGDDQADPAARRRALRSLAASGQEDLAAFLQERVLDKVLGLEAIRGLIACDDPKTVELLVNRYNHFPPECKTASIGVLASRAAFAGGLLEAISRGPIPRSALSAFHARQIMGFGEDALTEQLEEVWGKVGAGSEERRKQIEEYEKVLAPERLADADLVKGHAAFEKNCAVCHVLFGEGKNIGPDLTGGQRDNLRYLLENILDPSAVLAQDFKMSHVFMKDGRLVTGVVLIEKEDLLTVQTQEEVLTLDRNEIDTIRPSEVSLMPEGLLEPISEKEVLDLFGYLMASSPPTSTN
jgi:putative heme-binding domain-containing protein